MSTHDTRAIDLHSADDVFAPRLAEFWRGLDKPDEVRQESTELLMPESVSSSTLINWDESMPVCHLPESAVHRVAFHSAGLKPRLQAVLAATWLDFLTFSGTPNQTHRIEPSHLVYAIQQRKRASVSVSQKLRVTREKALASTLLSPSGAYLSWIEMDTSDASN